MKLKVSKVARVFLSIHLASDLFGSSARGFPIYQEAHDSLKINPSTLATVRWVDDRELLTSLKYWRRDGYVYGLLLNRLVTGDLPCAGYEGSREPYGDF
jgi:hypothetical protein